MSFLIECRRAALLSCVLLLLCGVVYPAALTGASRLLAPEKAEGSLLYHNGQAIGSALVGQTFTAPHFLKGRPSAVGTNTYTLQAQADGSYTGPASGSANLAPSNPALRDRVAADMQAFLAAHPGMKPEDVPADLLTASGSGLDPHISPQAAAIQLPELARQSGLSIETLRSMVARHTTDRLWGLFGEPVVHVLGVNMDIAQALEKR